MADADTIVAVSTPRGYSSRAVVRLSGPAAMPCVQGRFRPDEGRDGWLNTFRATRGKFALLGPGVSTDAVLYVMRAPRSYTREDVAEVHVSGSACLLDLLLDDLLEHGPGALRLAEPGEFTRRAFLNGRIDLSQAEAVLGVIRARTEAELLAATSRLEGAAGRHCARLQEQVTGLRVQVEAALDFAPHGIELISRDEFLERCEILRTEAAREAEKGRGEIATQSAIDVVLCGPPNAGKSSLLNRLTGADRAIVHETAGTTRDAVGGELEVDGVHFRLTDTAGLENAATGPTARGVELARERMGSSHLVLLVLDGSAPPPQDALQTAISLPESRVLCVVNKCDLAAEWNPHVLREMGLDCEVVRTSALTGEGLDELRSALWRIVAEGRLDASAADCLFNARQRRALRRAVEEIRAAERAVRDGLGYEFAALNLREAAAALGEVTGRVTSQDVLDHIFGHFCIGK